MLKVALQSGNFLKVYRLVTDSIVSFSKLTEATNRAVPDSVSDSIGKLLSINNYLRLAYMINAHRYEATKEIRIFYLYVSEPELRTTTDNMTDFVAMANTERRFAYISVFIYVHAFVKRFLDNMQRLL